MQQTPHKTSQRIDYVIDRLNSRWDLQIPRLHGDNAVEVGKDSDLARKCSSRIRALCWKDNVNMNSVVEEFEDKIQHKYSQWIWKPFQQSGTLPSLPVTKSFLKRDAISENKKIASQHRQIFLRALYDLLEEEYKLAKESELYQRTPSESSCNDLQQRSFGRPSSSSVSSSHTTSDSYTAFAYAATMENGFETSTSRSASLKKREAPRATTAVQSDDQVYRTQTDRVQSSKRTKTNSITSTSRTEKGQKTLSEMIERAAGRFMNESASTPTTMHSLSQSDQNIQSFTTNATEEPDRVFSEAETDPTNSNSTSFMSMDEDDQDRRYTELSGTQYSGETELLEGLREDVNLHRSMVKSEETSTSRTTAEMLEGLQTDGPFRDCPCPLPTSLPYWNTFELYRLSQHFGLEIGWLWNTLKDKRLDGILPSETLWKEAKALYQVTRNGHRASHETPTTLPTKSCVPFWLSKTNLYCDQDSGNSISFAGRLEIADKPSKSLFVFKLQAIKVDKSCRFHRRYGADRFLTIDMPYYERSMPGYIRDGLDGREVKRSLHDHVFKWLVTNDLNIAGRRWRAFYIEPIKSRAKKKYTGDKSRQRLHLFAVDGFDFGKPSRLQAVRHQSMSILEFVDTHLSLQSNSQSTDMKLFARLQLGLSKTLATVVLEPHEFIYVSDIPAQDENGRNTTDGKIMTDGCARMSYQLACEVWKRYEKPGEDMPSAFQARIGGAKGLWHVDYSNAHADVGERGFWIEIRESQLKIKPNPAECRDVHDSHRTFEVVKHSTPCARGHLNVQLINIMHYCGVNSSSLEDMIRADLKEYLESLTDAMEDPLRLRVWLQANHPGSSARDTVRFCGGMPDSKEEELNYMLESGFAPRSCKYLADGLKTLVKQELDSYVEKLRIKVEASTTAFCIPDPLGVLAPGEIQLNFSKPKTHPLTKLQETHLDSPRVLVARNPAHLSSDVQMVKAVYKHELRHLKDVVIFPTKGPYPLADLLSGGDYDGDTVMVIWEPMLTKDFKNHAKRRMDSKEECGIKSQNRYVHEIFDTRRPTSDQVDDFLYTCCSFNGHSSKLGEVTMELEDLIYTDLKNLGKPEVETHAALAGYLVDSSKQGDLFSSKAWNTLRQRIRTSCGILVPARPAYREGETRKPARDRHGMCINIIDHLKFDIADGFKEEVLQDFERRWTPGGNRRDRDVKNYHRREQDRAKALRAAESQATNQIFDDLTSRIAKLNVEWQRRTRRNDEAESFQSRYGGKTGQEDYAQVVQELTNQLRAIEPLNVECEIRREFERAGGARGTRWSLLRAALMHVEYSLGSMAWKLAGDELCTIKARAHPCGRTWEITLAARQIMKADVRAFTRRTMNNEFGGEMIEDSDG